MKMQGLGACSCAAFPPPPTWYFYFGYALFGLILLVSALIVWRWIATKWPRLSPAQLFVAYGLTVAILPIARMTHSFAYFQLLLLVAYGVLAVYITSIVAAWLYRGATRPALRTRRGKFEAFVFFLPPDVRESFWADWKGDRKKMIARGYGRPFRTCVFAWQIAWEVGAFFKGELRALVVDVIVGIIKPRL
jgi:hypothetical protein